MDAIKIVSPQESLNIITEAIARTKDNFKENSFCFLLWGWLIAIASILFFMLDRYTTIAYYFIPFPILGGAGVVATIIHFQKRRATTQTHVNYIITKLWTVLAIGFIVTVIVNIAQKQLPFTDTLIIAGVGTLVSGWIMRFKPLIVGGFLFFAASIATLFIGEEYKALIHGIAIIMGYLIPGYLLKQSKV